MKIKRTIGALFATLLMMAGAAASKTTTDYDHNANFAMYKTYTWAQDQRPAKDPLWNERIVDSIDKQLAAKGLTKVFGEADLTVRFNGGVEQNTSLQGFGSGGRFWGGNFSLDRVTTVEGTLTVEMIDGITNRLVWRGVASETASDKTDKNISKLDKDVEKLFKEYPPKPKK